MDENKIHDLALLILGKIEYNKMDCGRKIKTVDLTKKVLIDYHEIVNELRNSDKTESKYEK